MLPFDSNNRHRVQFCPCGKSNNDGKFVPFIGHDEFGHCYSCSKTFFPNNRGSSSIELKKTNSLVKLPDKKFDTINFQAVEDSMKNYSRNNLYHFLVKLLGEINASKIAQTYRLGTTKFWGGSTVFWQIDYNYVVRSGKIIQYKIQPDETCIVKVNCKRIKENIPAVKWVHKVPKNLSFNLKQCFFGEHLLKEENTKPVAIVESEKTAIISSGYFPDFIWLASGSLGGLTKSKCEVLRGRKIILFPDINGYETWSEKIKEISKTVYPGTVHISDFLQKNATSVEKAIGADIADVLIKLDPKKFQKE